MNKIRTSIGLFLIRLMVRGTISLILGIGGAILMPKQPTPQHLWLFIGAAVVLVLIALPIEHRLIDNRLAVANEPEPMRD